MTNSLTVFPVMYRSLTKDANKIIIVIRLINNGVVIHKACCILGDCTHPALPPVVEKQITAKSRKAKEVVKTCGKD